MSDSTGTILARQLHLAASEVIRAHRAGDSLAESRARSRLEALSAAFRSAGHTEDELERAKAGGGLAGILSAFATLTRNAAVLVVVGLGAYLYLRSRKR